MKTDDIRHVQTYGVSLSICSQPSPVESPSRAPRSRQDRGGGRGVRRRKGHQRPQHAQTRREPRGGGDVAVQPRLELTRPSCGRLRLRLRRDRVAHPVDFPHLWIDQLRRRSNSLSRCGRIRCPSRRPRRRPRGPQRTPEDPRGAARPRPGYRYRDEFGRGLAILLEGPESRR